MTPRALILQHGDDGPPALLADWARARGIVLEIHHGERAEPLPELGDQAFIATLGSDHSPNDQHIAMVATERAYLTAAVSREIPVLGLCFGGQMLAGVLGGEVQHAPEPEIGWYEVQSSDPELVPPGPWLQWHYDRFHTPPGAQRIATSPAGDQAFTHGRCLGVQFHPESTLEIVRGWADADAERLQHLGIDGQQRLTDGAHHGAGAQAAAFQLFDAFWRRAQA